jgi:hypothetical protein
MQVPSSQPPPSSSASSQAADLPRKKPRARVSDRKRKKAKELAATLLLIRESVAKEPELADIVGRAAEAATRLGDSTRQVDRKLVYDVLKSFESVETGEIIEDTGLSRWVVDVILKQFELRGFVKKISLTDPAEAGGRPRDLWTLAIRIPKKRTRR